MKEIEVRKAVDGIIGFPYRLTEWQKELKDLDGVISQFKQYGEEKYGCVINSPKGFAVFSTGKNIITESDKTRSLWVSQ